MTIEECRVFFQRLIDERIVRDVGPSAYLTLEHEHEDDNGGFDVLILAYRDDDIGKQEAHFLFSDNQFISLQTFERSIPD